jgi:HD superfamily phosphohydrolase
MLIQDLVKGEDERYTKQNPTKKWLFDIVSNHRSSFDLDKLDYLNRDLLHTKINSS